MRKTRRTSRVGESVRDALVEVFRFDLKDVATGLAGAGFRAPAATGSLAFVTFI